MATPYITRDEVIDIAPELADIDPARMDRIIELLTPRVPVSVWGDLAQAGMALLVAHFLTVSNRGKDGQVTEEKVGEISRKYKVSDADAGLMQTSYGQEYAELKKLVAVGPMVAEGS